MTARGLLLPGNRESRLFRSRRIVVILPMDWGTVDKQLGCWVFCHGVVGFVFKFGSNWTNFDVSTPFLMRRGGEVSVRERCPRWLSCPTSLSLTLHLAQHVSVRGSFGVFHPSSGFFCASAVVVLEYGVSYLDFLLSFCCAALN